MSARNIIFNNQTISEVVQSLSFNKTPHKTLARCIKPAHKQEIITFSSTDEDYKLNKKHLLTNA